MSAVARVADWIRKKNRSRLEARHRRRQPAVIDVPSGSDRADETSTSTGDTIGGLLAGVRAQAPRFAARLDELKRQNPQVSWYPFRSMDKLHLISTVGGYFEESRIPFLKERPAVVDVGAADGDMSFLFEAAGCDVVAVDNANSNFNRCAGIRSMRQLLGSSVKLVEKDIDYDFGIEGQYDLILFMDILYHLRNPLGALIALCQFGQYMVLTTRIFENAPGLPNAKDAPAAYLLGPFEAAPNDPTNYWIFTEAGLERLLQRSGWRIVRKSWFGYSGNDASPFEPHKDRRVVALCERVKGYEQLKTGHVISA